MNSNNNNILKLHSITKKFPGVLALDKVDFDLIEGEIHVLLGENGAGKSTLVKIISGAYLPDDGFIELFGDKVDIRSPIVSKEYGIQSIYQDWNVFKDITVAENIFVGNLQKVSKNKIFTNWKRCFEEAKKVMDYLNIDIDPHEKLENLSPAEQQLIEITRCIAGNARIMIMDEPTATLGAKEIDVFFDFIKTLKEKKISIIFITHKLEEIFRIGDRITVLRDGKKISTVYREKVDEKELIEMMVGKNVSLASEVEQRKAIKKPDEKIVFEIKNLSIDNKLHDINIKLRKGEILGIFGLVGAGQKMLVDSIFGVVKADKGIMYINGKEYRHWDSVIAKNLGMGLIPADRKKEGLILCLDMIDNITITNLQGIVKNGFINSNLEKTKTNYWIDKLNIRPKNPEILVQNMSGGNQQKVVISKWLENDSKILILNEPTQGVDVVSKTEVHNILQDLASKGISIILCSTEVFETLNLCHRINIIYKGTIIKELYNDEADKNKLVYYASGGK